MFFLLRVAFWLTLVLALLPSGQTQQSAQAGTQVGAVEAVGAATAAVADMSNFCDRQPTACDVGAQTVITIGQRAQAGARMVFDFINDRLAKNAATGSIPDARMKSIPAYPGSQSTLRADDLEPAWQGPPSQTEAVPLPRPRRQAAVRLRARAG
jgi:hypothetical protein